VSVASVLPATDGVSVKRPYATPAAARKAAVAIVATRSQLFVRIPMLSVGTDLPSVPFVN